MLDEYMSALAHERRRQIALALLERGDDAQVSVSEFAARRADDAESARVDLTHVHLPKLGECGIVDWDREADVVTRGPNFDDARPIIEAVDTLRPDADDGR